MNRKFGYQPQGRGEPPAPPKSGSNVRRPLWIPVSERLPEEWWPVLGLIQYHDEKEPPAQQVLWYLGNGHWRETWRGDMIESDVTHWMPLPQPPEEE